MPTENQEDSELTLDELLEKYRRKYRHNKNYSHKAVSAAVKEFDRVYNARDEKEKVA